MKYFEQFAKFAKSPGEPAAIVGVALYTVFIMFLVAVVYAGSMKWGVYSGNQLVMLVGDPTEAREIINQMIDEYPQGDAAALLNRLYLKKTGETGPVISGYALKASLYDTVTSRVRGSEILVDGRVLLALGSRADAEKLLDTIKNQYSAPGVSASFVENVQIADTMVEKIKIMSVETALDTINGGDQKLALYEIKDGDTIWDIAKKSGQTVEDIVALNPGISAGRLQPGDKISLSKSQPLINVKTIATKTSDETVDPPVEEKSDSSLYVGEKRLLASGKSGEREVTYQIVSVNGVECERNVMQEVWLQNAEPKVVATGTRALLVSRGSGGGGARLSWPAVGPVTSPFGRRHGEFHPGVDIGASYGSAVIAAQAGTVIRAGWYSGYGKCIDISHGNGIVTRYGHLSYIAVSVGQQVAGGQFIGRVGATGYATGPHLHFEVRINGVPRNPMSFF